MQTDLFGTQSLTNPTAPKTDFLQRYRFSLRLDQAVVMLIVLLVVYVLVFSFGVEKGKRFAMAELKAERAKRQKMMEEFQAKFFLEAHPEPLPAVPAGLLPVSATTASGQPAENEAASEVRVLSATGADSVPKGKYTIQIITFKSKQAAEKEIKRLAGIGQQGFILPKGKYLHVCIAAFNSAKKASEVLGELKANGLVPKDAYVRPIS